MKELLDAGLLKGDAITVTGKTIAENLEEVGPPAPDGTVVRPFSEPIHPEGGTAILYGSLAPEGSVMKIAGAASLEFRGRARPFDSEQEAFEAVTSGTIVAGDVIVIRYEGPRGSPGMPEMLAVTAAVAGAEAEVESAMTCLPDQARDGMGRRRSGIAAPPAGALTWGSPPAAWCARWCAGRWRAPGRPSSGR
jgi:dihydroxyacid dehydratase/phosphogluconate dehydratase